MHQRLKTRARPITAGQLYPEDLALTAPQFLDYLDDLQTRGAGRVMNGRFKVWIQFVNSYEDQELAPPLSKRQLHGRQFLASNSA